MLVTVVVTVPQSGDPSIQPHIVLAIADAWLMRLVKTASRPEPAVVVAAVVAGDFTVVAVAADGDFNVAAVLGSDFIVVVVVVDDGCDDGCDDDCDDVIDVARFSSRFN